MPQRGGRFRMTRLGLCDRLQTQTPKQEVRMTVASHIAELKKKHEHLSEMVAQAQRSPGSDDLQIAEWKKQKLKIKEEIERLSHA
jgi:hypothetical protein